MGEKPDQIERHIHEKRNELGENINELRQKVKTAVDWRARFEQRPMTMMGLAFGGGLLLSILFSNRQNSHDSSNTSSRNRWRSESERSDYGARAQDWKNSAATTWDNIRGAALSVAGTKFGQPNGRGAPGISRALQENATGQKLRGIAPQRSRIRLAHNRQRRNRLLAAKLIAAPRFVTRTVPAETTLMLPYRI